MKKFRIMILNRLFYDEGDGKKSQEVLKELQKLEAGYPAIVKRSEETKEGIWISYEAMRKGNILGYSRERLQGLQAALYQARANVTVPLKQFDDQRNDLLGKLEALSRELRNEILGHIKNYISQVEQIKSMEELSREPNFDMEVRVVQDNFAACERMINSLIVFKTEIIAMGNRSFEEILEAVKKFETEVSSIDVLVFEKEETIRPLKSAARR